jgi:hypothetical protein
MTRHPSRHSPIRSGRVYASREPAWDRTGQRARRAATEHTRCAANLLFVAAGQTIGPVTGPGVAEYATWINQPDREETS